LRLSDPLSPEARRGVGPSVHPDLCDRRTTIPAGGLTPVGGVAVAVGPGTGGGTGRCRWPGEEEAGGGWQLQFRQSVAEGVPLSCAWLKPKKLGSHNYHICPTAKGWVKADKKCMIESYNTTHQLNKHNIEHR